MQDSPFVALTKRGLLAMFWLVFRIQYRGLHHIPATGAAVLVSNHQSYLDPLLVGAALPRSVRYMAMHSLFVYRPISILLRFYGAFPVVSRTSDVTAVKASLRYLRAGELVLMFPEGERSFDGRLLEFFPGFARIARRGEVPIVPVTIQGAVRVWPRSARWPRPAKVCVTFHAPLHPACAGAEPAADAAHLSSLVREAMTSALEGGG
jgi:1-acyl-sn-glycerol-3-phosphate acyltransferase